MRLTLTSSGSSGVETHVKVKVLMVQVYYIYVDHFLSVCRKKSCESRVQSRVQSSPVQSPGFIKAHFKFPDKSSFKKQNT